MKIVVKTLTAAEVPQIAAKIQAYLDKYPGAQLLSSFAAQGEVALIYRRPLTAAETAAAAED